MQMGIYAFLIHYCRFTYQPVMNPMPVAGEHLKISIRLFIEGKLLKEIKKLFITAEIDQAVPEAGTLQPL
jgi:hypothetical protein